MKYGVVGGCLLLGLVSSRLAFAETPPAKTGFQMALRTGYSVPFGDLGKDFKLSDFSSGQVPLFVDIGGKPIPHLFVGGYFGLSFGGAGGRTADDCERTNSGCFGLGLRFGAQLQVHLLPHGPVNPWFGYGIGLESIALSVDQQQRGGAVAAGVGGVEFARLMGGVDFRLSRVVGVGPFVDVTFGRYSTLSFNDGDTTRSFDIIDSERATHGWATFGARVVFFP